MPVRTARWINAIVGLWLLLSAFSWPHSTAQFTNTWIMGIITIAVALIAMGSPGFRFVNTIAGAWLIVSAFALPTLATATRWNNFIIGIVIGFLSLVGTAPGADIRQPRTV